MEKIQQFDSIPEEYTSEFLGGHTQCLVYKVKGQPYVYKNVDDIAEEESLYRDMLDIESDYFAFPETLIYLKGKLNGLLASYLEGNSLSSLPIDTDMLTLLTSLNALENEIVNLAKQGVYVMDYNFDNIILGDDNTLKMCDTGLCSIVKGYNKELYVDTIKDYNEGILNLFRDLSKFPLKDSKLNNYYHLCLKKGVITASAFLNELLTYLKQYGNISTYGEMKRTLALSRKK